MNIRLVHEEAISPDPTYQKRPLEWFVGRSVKIGFQSHEGKVEWMWITVQGVKSPNLIGTLDNDPMFCTHLIHGDPISLSRLQIAAVDLTIEEWWVEVDALRAR